MERYGFDPNAADAAAGWVQNRWAIPSFQAPYLKTAQCFVISQDNKLWQQDVREALRFLRDKAGVHSIGWDQYLAAPCEGNISDLLEEYIQQTKELHPDMAISGESTIFSLKPTSIISITPGTGTISEKSGIPAPITTLCAPLVPTSMSTAPPSGQALLYGQYVSQCLSLQAGRGQRLGHDCRLSGIFGRHQAVQRAAG